MIYIYIYIQIPIHICIYIYPVTCSDDLNSPACLYVRIPDLSSEVKVFVPLFPSDPYVSVCQLSFDTHDGE